MKRRLVGLALALSLVGAAPSAVADSSSDSVRAVASKTCGSGYRHAVINGSHKCLRRGQFCARGADRQYHRYGYHCHKRDSRGNYHLS